MFSIEGAITIVPVGIGIEAGHMQVAEDKPQQPVVVQSYITENGPVVVAIPADEIDKLIDGLKKAKEEIKDAPAPNSDLYIPKSQEEVKNFAEQIGKVT